MALLGSFTKQPREVLDFDISYATVLAGRTDTVTGVVLEVTPVGLTLGPAVITDNIAKGKVSAGTTGVSYTVTAIATTTAGLVYEDEILVLVEEV